MQHPLRNTVRIAAIMAMVATAGISFAQVESPAGSFAQPAIQAPSAPQAVKASTNAFVFDKTAHDYGQITEGDIVEVSFPCKNVTDRTINIKAINTSCGCTSAQDNLKIIPAGTTSEIKVAFNSTGKPGKGQKTVSVVTDEAETGGLYQLTIGGEVIQTLFSTEPIINLGELNSGEAATHTFNIVSMTEPAAEVTRVSLGDDRITATIGAPEEYTHKDGRKGHATPITLTVPADYPAPKSIRTTLTVASTDAKRSTLNLMVNGNIVGNFVVSPQRVLLGRFAPGEVKEQTITMRSKKDEAFEVTMATKNSNPSFTISEVTGDKPNVREWKVSFTAPETAGNFAETVEFNVKSANVEEVISVPMTANVRTPPSGTQVGRPATKSDSRVIEGISRADGSASNIKRAAKVSSAEPARIRRAAPTDAAAAPAAPAAPANATP